jgi:DNA-directed RNA polymerase specialized sigma24 family protein
MSNLAQVYSLHHKELVHLAWDQEDLVQEAYTRLVRYAYKPVNELLGMAIVAIRHLRIDGLRRQEVQQRALRLLAIEPAPESHTTEIHNLRLAIQHLRPEYREVIAKSLAGVKLNAMERQRLHRAKQQLKAIIA